MVAARWYSEHEIAEILNEETDYLAEIRETTRALMDAADVPHGNVCPECDGLGLIPLHWDYGVCHTCQGAGELAAALVELDHAGIEAYWRDQSGDDLAAQED